MMKNQASLFPRYRVSPIDSTKEGHYVMYDSPSATSKSLLSSTNDGYKITYVSKEKRQEIVSLDKGLSEFSSVSFVDATLNSCSCQHSTNYGFPCHHQFAVVFSCDL